MKLLVLFVLLVVLTQSQRGQGMGGGGRGREQGRGKGKGRGGGPREMLFMDSSTPPHVGCGCRFCNQAVQRLRDAENKADVEPILLQECKDFYCPQENPTCAPKCRTKVSKLLNLPESNPCKDYCSRNVFGYGNGKGCGICNNIVGSGRSLEEAKRVLSEKCAGQWGFGKCEMVENMITDLMELGENMSCIDFCL